jgi:hypothetical protein
MWRRRYIIFNLQTNKLLAKEILLNDFFTFCVTSIGNSLVSIFPRTKKIGIEQTIMTLDSPGKLWDSSRWALVISKFTWEFEA